MGNGKEFAEHGFTGQCLGAQVCFAHACCSWERGLSENRNGLLRQYFPKKMSWREVTQMQLDEAVYALNHHPHKCWNHRSPHEVFYRLEMTPLTLSDGALRT